MHVIVKRPRMEPTQENTVSKRRSFFIQLIGGIAGGWIAGNLFSGIIRATTSTKDKGAIQVTINPLAVPRTKKEMKSFGA